MKFKLLVAMVEHGRTDAVTDAARATGATGCTVITNARGEGLKPSSTFLGL
ncbi:MAG: P-II family nitrogen regulator, partial [Pseudomonadota bacterium]